MEDKKRSKTLSASIVPAKSADGFAIKFCSRVYAKDGSREDRVRQ